MGRGANRHEGEQKVHILNSSGIVNGVIGRRRGRWTNRGNKNRITESMIFRELWGWLSWEVVRLCDEGDERVLESEVMEEEVMWWNVLLSYVLDSFEYLPFVKGTSDENERVMEVVSENEFCPIMNTLNFGRSNQLRLESTTGEIQWGCHIEWTISCCKCCELRKIQSMTIQVKYSINSMRLCLWMNHLLLWMWWILEDPINDYSNQILDKLNEVVYWNDSHPVMNVVNWGRSNQWLFNSNTR